MPGASGFRSATATTRKGCSFFRGGTRASRIDMPCRPAPTIARLYDGLSAFMMNSKKIVEVLFHCHPPPDGAILSPEKNGPARPKDFGDVLFLIFYPNVSSLPNFGQEGIIPSPK